jgi:hypothetical protein
MPEVDLETLKKVLNHKNAASAPGPDGIGNLYWKKLPAFHELVIILLNRCIREISLRGHVIEENSCNMTNNTRPNGT